MPGMIQPERRLTWTEDGYLHSVSVLSLFSGQWNVMESPEAHPGRISRAQWNAWQAGQHIQHAMPQLTPEEREFLLTGATPQEWDAAFGDDDDDPYHHALTTNPRYLAARATCTRSGAAFTNGAAFMPRSLTDYIVTTAYGIIALAGIFALCVGIGALWGTQ